MTYEELIGRCKKLQTEAGVELAYEEAGEGDKYIISVQMGFEDRYYVREFAAHGYHVFMIWNRGAGPSVTTVADSGKGWYNAWADDVVAFADRMGIDRFIYAGASHGSGTGWHLLWKHPERVTAFLALVCGPHNIEESSACFREFVLAHPELNLGHGKHDDERANARIAHVQPLSDEIRPHQLNVNYGRPLAELGTEAAVQELLKTLKTPTLLLGGMQDMIARPDLMLRSATCLPNCKLVLYSNMAHADPSHVFIEEVVAECLHFLKAVENNDRRIYLPIEEDK